MKDETLDVLKDILAEVKKISAEQQRLREFWEKLLSSDGGAIQIKVRQ